MAENKIPTAEEHFRAFFKKDGYSNQFDLYEWGVAFAKLHVEAALKAAAEKANIIQIPDHYNLGSKTNIVEQDSILNAYPLTNIK